MGLFIWSLFCCLAVLYALPLKLPLNNKGMYVLSIIYLCKDIKKRFLIPLICVYNILFSIWENSWNFYYNICKSSNLLKLNFTKAPPSCSNSNLQKLKRTKSSNFFNRSITSFYNSITFANLKFGNDQTCKSYNLLFKLKFTKAQIYEMFKLFQWLS